MFELGSKAIQFRFCYDLLCSSFGVGGWLRPGVHRRSNGVPLRPFMNKVTSWRAFRKGYFRRPRVVVASFLITGTGPCLESRKLDHFLRCHPIIWILKPDFHEPSSGARLCCNQLPKSRAHDYWGNIFKGFGIVIVIQVNIPKWCCFAWNEPGMEHYFFVYFPTCVWIRLPFLSF